MRNLWKFNLFDSKVDENVNDVICNNFIDVRGEKGFDGYAEWNLKFYRRSRTTIREEAEVMKKQLQFQFNKLCDLDDSRYHQTSSESHR